MLELDAQIVSLLAAAGLALLWAGAAIGLTMRRLMRDLRRARASQLATLQAAAREAERRADETHDLLEELREANRIIREREQAFRLTFDRSPLGGALIAPDGRFLRVNEALCATTGYGEAKLLRHDVFMVVHEDDRAAARARGAALLAGAERVSFEARARRADGATIWLQVAAGLVSDDQGRPLHFLALVEDVTARKGYEQHLRTAERQMQLVLRTIPEHFWLKDGAGRYLLASHSLARFYGRRPEELIGRTADELYRPELVALIRESEAAALSEGQATYTELRIADHEGEQRRLTITRAPVYDDDGTLVGVVGMARDITAQREAQERLRAQEALLRSVSDNLPDGLIFQMERSPDGSGRFRYLSAGVERLWGVSAETAYADPEALWSRLHPEDRPAFERAAREAFERLSVFEFEGRVCLPDGATRWSYSRSTPHPLPDGRVLRSGIELDISARKRAEADMQRRIEALQVLNQIGQALTSWTRIADGLAAAAGLLGRLFHSGPVAVWEYDAAAEALRPLLLPGQSAARPPGPAPALHASELGPELLERHEASAMHLEPGHPLLAGLGGRAGPTPSALVLSLRAHNSLVGLLCIGAPEGAPSFTPEDLALSETVGSLLAGALENARLFVHARSDAAEQERRRLARELHDSVSQALFAANRTAELLPQLWELDPDEGREALRDLHRFTGAALAEMRALLIELRPRALIETPLHKTLGFLLPAAAARSASALSQRLAPAPPLPPEVQVALYRIAQEALSNACRHARAPNVTLALAVAPAYTPGKPWEGAVSITVADDGRGFDPATARAGHFGLATMRERAADIGASLEVASAPGAGATVTVTWRGAAARPAEELAA